MSMKHSRRQVLKSSMAAGVGFWVVGRSEWARAASPNEKLNIACVGIGGRGAGNLDGMIRENVVAVCDVDEAWAADSFKRVPKAVKFNDYRKLLDKMHKEIDAVVVSTPDHMHAPVSLAAMELGKHVYCEKPLTHTIAEARRMAEAAAKYKVVTQMGNGGNALSRSRRAVEMLRAGILGSVREVHAWSDRPAKIWTQGIDRPADTPPVPPTLKWDLWLGVAPERPYHPAYLPGKWRGWFDFGTGAMGDMACHICNVAYWGLGLKDPAAVEAEVSGLHKETFPNWSKIVWEFPARGDQPALKFRWYDGGKKPAKELGPGGDLPDNGLIIVGDKGRMFIAKADEEDSVLLPKEAFENVKRPEKTIPDSPGHHEEWIRNCKTGDQGLDYMSHFGRAAIMTEGLLLGNLAVRTGKRIEWDAKAMKVTNLPEANAFLDTVYRKGW